METVLRHAAGRRVTVVRIRIGALRQVVPGSLAFHFGLLKRGTDAEGAGLELQPVPARLRCTTCASEWEPRCPDFRCAACGDGEGEVLAGTEFEIESIDVEETQCIAPG